MPPTYPMPPFYPRPGALPCCPGPSSRPEPFQPNPVGDPHLAERLKRILDLLTTEMAWVKANKVDKAPEGVPGNIAGINEEGNLYDTGKRAAGVYDKPDDGIPYADLSEEVQEWLDAASTAVQPAEGAKTSGNLASWGEGGVLADSGKKPADFATAGAVAAIEGKIPSQASSSNQLADKDFVNSSIATETATFRGTFNLVTDLGLPLNATHEQVAAAVKTKLGQAAYDKHDYVFVQIPQDLEHTDAMKQVDRYKCVETGTDPVVKNWAYEWTLNNSSFTAAQWAAINSGITSAKVTKLDALPSAAELAQALAGKVSISRTVNGKALDADVTLTGADIAVSGTDATKIDAALADKATKADATLTERKFSAWELDYSAASTPGPIDNKIKWSGYVWIAALQRVCGASKSDLASYATVTWAPGEWGSGTTSALVGTWTGDHWEPSITEYDGYPLVIFGSRDDATPAQEMTGGVAGEGSSDPNALELQIDVALTWPSSGGSGTVVATRTSLSGYVLGSQTDKPLASEAEAEALRTAVASKQDTLSQTQLANIAAVSDALAFDATHSYASGDPVVYDGTLYTFTAAHTGAWTGSDVSAVDIIARLADVVHKTGAEMISGLKTFSSGIWMGEHLTLDYYRLRFGGLYDVYAVVGTESDEVEFIEPRTDATLRLRVGNGGQLAHGDAIAPDFSEESTYAVGEHVMYAGSLYRCTTAVTTAGTWTGSTNWTADTMTDPDAVLDVTSVGQLRVVAKDGTVLWAQGYDLASTSSATLACDAANNFTFANGATSQAFTLPTAPTGKVGDFGLDIDNSANTSAATMTLTGLDSTFSVVVPEGESLNDMLAIAAGELARFYITLSTFRVNNLPTWHIVKQIVENGGAQS